MVRRRVVLAAAVGFIVLSMRFWAYRPDWTGASDEIVAYGVVCRENLTDGSCGVPDHVLVPFTFRVDKASQTVQRMVGTWSVQTLSRCSVVDIRNWTCMWGGKLAVLNDRFGFKDGVYFHIYDDPRGEVSEFHDVFERTYYVSRDQRAAIAEELARTPMRRRVSSER